MEATFPQDSEEFAALIATPFITFHVDPPDVITAVQAGVKPVWFSAPAAPLRRQRVTSILRLMAIAPATAGMSGIRSEGSTLNQRSAS
jgi:hypothetical protein